MGQISLRDAQPKDIPTIIELIQLKAEFDDCRESAEATPDREQREKVGSGSFSE